MATIQNSAIIQKLVDELELYPALDKIPTELAEKILPVFQVNTETIKLQAKPNYHHWQDVSPNDSDKTLTIPDGHTYVIKTGMLKYGCDATAATRYPALEIHDKAGNLIWIQEVATMTANANRYFRFNVSGGSIQVVADTNENNVPLRTMPFPADFVMLEGWTLRWGARYGGGQAGDDIEISIMVDDQLD